MRGGERRQVDHLAAAHVRAEAPARAEHHIGLARRGAAIVSKTRPDDEILEAVAIDVPRRGNADAGPVTGRIALDDEALRCGERRQVDISRRHRHHRVCRNRAAVAIGYGDGERAAGCWRIGGIGVGQVLQQRIDGYWRCRSIEGDDKIVGTAAAGKGADNGVGKADICAINADLPRAGAFIVDSNRILAINETRHVKRAGIEIGAVQVFEHDGRIDDLGCGVDGVFGKRRGIEAGEGGVVVGAGDGNRHRGGRFVSGGVLHGIGKDIACRFARGQRLGVGICIVERIGVAAGCGDGQRAKGANDRTRHIARLFAARDITRRNPDNRLGVASIGVSIIGQHIAGGCRIACAGAKGEQMRLANVGACGIIEQCTDHYVVALKGN